MSTPALVVDPESTWSRVLTGAGVVSALAVVVAGDGDDGVVLCPFRRCTGGYCPGCGGSRAAARLLRGDLAGAWHRHPAVVLLAAQLVAVGALAAGAAGRAWVASRWVAFTTVNAGLLVAVWVLRLGLGDIPRPF